MKNTKKELYEVISLYKARGIILARCTSEEFAKQAVQTFVSRGWDEKDLQIMKSKLNDSHTNFCNKRISSAETEAILRDNPMSLRQQFTICDENGYLEGNIVIDLCELIEWDLEEILDMMSERLIGNPLLTDSSFGAINVDECGNLIMRIRGCIEEAVESGEGLDAICEEIKNAILSEGEKAVEDFLDTNVWGKSIDEISEMIDDTMDQMPIIEMTKYFKKYVLKVDVNNDAKERLTETLGQEMLEQHGGCISTSRAEWIKTDDDSVQYRREVPELEYDQNKVFELYQVQTVKDLGEMMKEEDKDPAIYAIAHAFIYSSEIDTESVLSSFGYDSVEQIDADYGINERDGILAECQFELDAGSLENLMPHVPLMTWEQAKETIETLIRR